MILTMTDPYPVHRDAVYRLARNAPGGTFTRTDIKDELGSRYDPAAVDDLVVRGLIVEVGPGRSRRAREPRGRKATLYRIVKPREQRDYRPDRDLKRPADPYHLHPRGGVRTGAPLPARGRPVKGTGKRKKVRSSDPTLNRFLDQAEAQGAQIVRQGNTEIRVVYQRRFVVVQSTPSEYRGILNARAELRRLGLTID